MKTWDPGTLVPRLGAFQEGKDERKLNCIHCWVALRCLQAPEWKFLSCCPSSLVLILSADLPPCSSRKTIFSLEIKRCYLKKNAGQFMISLQPSNHLPFPFPLTSKFRVSSTFFIPFLCATILSSFKPSSGLLVIISHREDSTSHLMKDEQASAVSCAQSLSPVRLLETLRTVACQAPLFMGFS